MALVFAAICPHPPLIIPTIGRPANLKLVSKTTEGMKKLAGKFAEAKPETIIVISPHGQIDTNNFTISKSQTLTGNFRHFGDPETKLVFENDQNLIEEIKEECEKMGTPLKLIEEEELDHGSLVPLYYLIKESPTPLYYVVKGNPNVKVVPLTISYLSIEDHFKFGKILNKVIKEKEQKTKIGIIASGDLSHRLTSDAPAGFSPQGKKFDEEIVRLLKTRNTEGILNLDPNLVEEAGECGYRPILVLLGALDGLYWQPEILSYEGPFGVGYLVAHFKIKSHEKL